jgi:hypothetical protein
LLSYAADEVAEGRVSCERRLLPLHANTRTHTHNVSLLLTHASPHDSSHQPTPCPSSFSCNACSIRLQVSHWHAYASPHKLITKSAVLVLSPTLPLLHLHLSPPPPRHVTSLRHLPRVLCLNTHLQLAAGLTAAAASAAAAAAAAAATVVST